MGTRASRSLSLSYPKDWWDGAPPIIQILIYGHAEYRAKSYEVFKGTFPTTQLFHVHYKVIRLLQLLSLSWITLLHVKSVLLLQPSLRQSTHCKGQVLYLLLYSREIIHLVGSVHLCAMIIDRQEGEIICLIASVCLFLCVCVCLSV